MSIAAQIESVQPDVFYKLCSEPFFLPVGIFMLREQRIDSEINASLAGERASALAGFSRPGSFPGATIEVLMPTLLSGDENTAGPVCTLEQAFIVKTNETISQGQFGSKLSCEQIAVQVAQTMQLFNLGNEVQGFYVAPNWYQPLNASAEADYLQIKVVMHATFSLRPVVRCKNPGYTDVANGDGTDTVTLTDRQAGGGSVIYYTTDASFPGPGNPAADVYNGAFVVPSQTIVRASAWSPTNPPTNGSVVTDTIST